MRFASMWILVVDSECLQVMQAGATLTAMHAHPYTISRDDNSVRHAATHFGSRSLPTSTAYTRPDFSDCRQEQQHAAAAAHAVIAGEQELRSSRV